MIMCMDTYARVRGLRFLKGYWTPDEVTYERGQARFSGKRPHVRVP